jgi:Mycothiol maleylpyruvate isomerase N-terminal domain
MTASDVPGAWVDVSKVALSAIRGEEVGSRWDQPSILPGMTIGSLASHLVLSVLAVEDSLTTSVPVTGVPVTAGQFLSRTPLDATSDTHVGIRSQAQARASRGRERVVQRAAASLDRSIGLLRSRSVEEVVPFLPRPDAPIPMTIGELLRSRIVELAVHLDDLACSVNFDDMPVVPAAASLVACQVGLEISINRYGPEAVARGFFRGDRSPVDALRAL